jgi:hypothetical protein
MTKYPRVRPNAMTAMSITPYFDFGVLVLDAALELTVEAVLEVLVELVLVVAVELAEVVLAPELELVDSVVAAVEFPVADEVIEALPEEVVEDWAKTPPAEDELLGEPDPDEETSFPSQEPEILMLS